MVEFGKVKFFDDREGKHYGFLMVVDADDNPTGEEIFFHYNDGKFVSCQTFVDPFAPSGNESIRLKVPRKLDKLVFERRPGRKGDKACPWSYANEWDVIRWRVVQKIREVTGIIEFAGTVDETAREEISAVIRTGSATQSTDALRRWTAESLEFFDDEASSYEGGHEEYLYYLQFMQGGKWVDLKGLRPTMYPEPPDDGYYNDPYPEDGCSRHGDPNCACDEGDPLAGDIDDGSDSLPLTYFESHGSMEPGYGWRPYPNVPLGQ